MRVAKDLIFDVGLHTGKDTAFYLAKGFRVVAVEANDTLVEEASRRFANEMDAGRLTIYHAAIGEREGTVDFFVNEQKDDWGTTSLAFVERNEAFGTTHTKVEVPCIPLQLIIEKHGIPYYAKIDIEGADLLCLEAFLDFAERPKYLSIEATLDRFEGVFAEFSHLWVLGYRRFKIVNQALHHALRCPQPALEGRYVDQRFDGYMSGPFGEEAPGAWLDIESAFTRYGAILADQRRFGARGRYHRTPLRQLDRWRRRWTRREPSGWYDIHAGRAT